MRRAYRSIRAFLPHRFEPPVMLDYFDLEADLSEEERMVRDTAREFVEDRVRPDIGDHWIEGTFPTEIITEMGELGFYAPNLDGYGLPNLSERAYGLLMRELEACDSGLRSMASVQGALVMYPIHAYGSDEQKERYLPALGAGEAVGCFGLTEPEHGSNPSAMETSAERDGDGYVLNGTKTWITNAPIADVALVWAKDRSAEDGDTVRGFLVDTDTAGVTTNKIEEKLSLRASVTGEIHLDDARVEASAVLPDVEGMKGPLSCLTQARYGIAWGAVGAAGDCFETARGYATDREQFGGPIGRFQLQQEKLAEMATQITLAQLLADRLAELKERGEMRPQHVSMAKRNNVRMARNQSRIAREILGGNGITADYSPMRHMANLETVYTYEGTHDIHTLVLGEDLTGLQAYQ
jgi:alkylation response protein AidB-like acyl-CoA dehydrogenase